jgi:hypothetical protein
MLIEEEYSEILKKDIFKLQIFLILQWSSNKKITNTKNKINDIM